MAFLFIRIQYNKRTSVYIGKKKSVGREGGGNEKQKMRVGLSKSEI